MNGVKMEERLEYLEKVLLGNGKLGVAQKVTIMWQVHLWLIGAVSFGLGCLTMTILDRWGGV